MYPTHRFMVIHSRAKHSITMSKDKKAVAQTQSHLPLGSKVNFISES